MAKKVEKAEKTEKNETKTEQKKGEIKYHKKYGDACLTSISVLFFTTPDIVNVELYNLVEVEGVEPSSEHIVIQLSPSADSILCFAPTPPADRLRHR